MRLLTTLRFLPLCLLLCAGTAAAEVKIAFVDMQRALLEVEDGKEAKQKLEKMKKERQAALDAQQESCARSRRASRPRRTS
ncbi:MAG: OmpH family outer membrane protein [bacterium]